MTLFVESEVLKMMKKHAVGKEDSVFYIPVLPSPKLDAQTRNVSKERDTNNFQACTPHPKLTTASLHPEVAAMWLSCEVTVSALRCL